MITAPVIALAVVLAPPPAVSVAPKPNDDGTHLVLTIQASPGALRYEVWRSAVATRGVPDRDPDWTLAHTLEVIAGPLVVEDAVEYRRSQSYAVRAVAGEARSDWVFTPPRAPVPSWFDSQRVFLLLVVVGMALLLAIHTRRKGGTIRRIAGIDAMEEAVGRATEMGRPVLYIPGIEEVQDIQTVAALLILGHVAELCARNDARLRVACCIPLTMVLAEEVVQQGFYRAGRPEAHRPQDIQFISSEQFAFAAGAVGVILREKPATNIYLGRFYGESLVLAEAGYTNGSIQIGGTAELTQLPFFIAACDYTLIGEELFAVSAYLTREPGQVATLKAADAFKLFIIVLVILGTILATSGWVDLARYVAP